MEKSPGMFSSKTFVSFPLKKDMNILDDMEEDSRCTKFYHSERADSALRTLCKGDVCLCAEENCSFQKKHQVRQERLVRACESGMDYVYKVTVLDIDLLQDSDIYDMKVQQMLKESTVDKKVEGKVRPFFAPTSWRDHLRLEKGKSYLIMGNSTDLSRQGGSLKYIFGEETWVEYWPTREESQTPQYRDQFIGITELQQRPLKEICAT